MKDYFKYKSKKNSFSKVPEKKEDIPDEDVKINDNDEDFEESPD